MLAGSGRNGSVRESLVEVQHEVRDERGTRNGLNGRHRSSHAKNRAHCKMHGVVVGLTQLRRDERSSWPVMGMSDRLCCLC